MNHPHLQQQQQQHENHTNTVKLLINPPCVY